MNHVANAVATIVLDWGSLKPTELRGPSRFWVSLTTEIISLKTFHYFLLILAETCLTAFILAISLV